VRFEALAVGMAEALEQLPANHEIKMDWLTTKEFGDLTRTDASNSGPRLNGRINFVRDSLLNE